MKLSSDLASWHLAGKRVFLRTDFNVPLRNGTILDDMRLQAIKPTLDFLRNNGAITIIGTHIDRPTQPDPSLSTQQLLSWFQTNEYPVIFAPDIQTAAAVRQPGAIVLLENLRFFPGEQQHDNSFAKQLATLAEYYVNDSFGTLHRTDTSTTLLPQQFPAHKRTIGFLIEKELETLDELMSAPKHPFIAIVGGGKGADKIPLIEQILTLADHIMLCPAIVFTFLKALGKPVGLSLVDDQSMDICKRILEKNRTKIMFPRDYQVAKNSVTGALSYVQTLAADEIGISIGPDTIAQWTPIIQKAGTVFLNGTIGFAQRPETLQGMQALLLAMSESSGTSIIGGGDSVAVARAMGLEHITHYAIGGGAALAYISGQPLPGVAIFLKNGAETQKT